MGKLELKGVGFQGVVGQVLSGFRAFRDYLLACWRHLILQVHKLELGFRTALNRGENVKHYFGHDKFAEPPRQAQEPHPTVEGSPRLGSRAMALF